MSPDMKVLNFFYWFILNNETMKIFRQKSVDQCQRILYRTAVKIFYANWLLSNCQEFEGTCFGTFTAIKLKLNMSAALRLFQYLHFL